eukprot:SAG11_NODE_4869_length_1739_cov_6.239634_1_plen_438_part_00
MIADMSQQLRGELALQESLASAFAELKAFAKQQPQAKPQANVRSTRETIGVEVPSAATTGAVANAEVATAADVPATAAGATVATPAARASTPASVPGPAPVPAKNPDEAMLRRLFARNKAAVRIRSVDKRQSDSEKEIKKKMAHRWSFFNGTAVPALLRFEKDFATWRTMKTSGEQAGPDGHVPAFARVKETLAELLGKDAPEQADDEEPTNTGPAVAEREDCAPLAGIPAPSIDPDEEAREAARGEMTSEEADALLDADVEGISEAAGEDALAIVTGASGFGGETNNREFDNEVSVPAVDNTIVNIGRDTLKPSANIIAFDDLGELKFALDAADDLQRALASNVAEHTEAIKNVRVLMRNPSGHEMGDAPDLTLFQREIRQNVKLGRICYSMQVELPGDGDMSVRIPISLQEEAADAHRQFKQQKARRLFYADKYA